MTSPEPTSQLITAAYKRITRDQLNRLLQVEYRCAESGCLLLHVWSSPNGPCFYAPSHKVQTVRQRTSDAGRPLNRGVERRHVVSERAGLLPACDSDQMIFLHCGHYELGRLVGDIADDFDQGTAGTPTRRRLRE